MGANDYFKLKEEYRSPSDPHSALEPEDPELPLGPKLVKAMIAAKRQQRDKTAFQGYMTAVGVPNPTELAGLYRWMITLKPSIFGQLCVALDCLRFIARLCHHEIYPNQFAIIRYWVDDVMCTAHEKANAELTTNDVFLQLHESLALLVLPKEALNKVCALGKDRPWSEVKQEICDICDSSTLEKYTA